MRTLSLFLFGIGVLWALPSGGQGTARPTPPPTRPAVSASFYRDVMPIFRTACIGCHSQENPTSGLALHTFAATMKGGRGGPAIVPGKSGESRLYKFLTGALKPVMPPGSGLKAPDIEKVKRWIDAGAKEDTPPTETGKKPRVLTKAPTKGTILTATPIAPRLKVPATVTALAFSPDSKTLFVGTYQEVQLWDTETRRLRQTWRGHGDAIRSLVFSPDGKILAAGGGIPGARGEVRLWDVAANREIRAFGDQGDVVYAVAFSPDGKRLASASGDKTIRLWNAETGEGVATLRDHSDAVWGLVWSRDGKRLASVGADKSLKGWDVAAAKRIYSVGAHEDVIYGLAMTPDGNNLVTVSGDRTAKLWSFGADNSGHQRTYGGHSHTVTALTLSTDGQTLATTSADKTVRLWRIGDGNNFRTFTEAKDWLYAVALSPDKKSVAAGDWAGAIYLWNLADGKLEATLSTLPTP